MKKILALIAMLFILGATLIPSVVLAANPKDVGRTPPRFTNPYKVVVAQPISLAPTLKIKVYTWKPTYTWKIKVYTWAPAIKPSK